MHISTKSGTAAVAGLDSNPADMMKLGQRAYPRPLLDSMPVSRRRPTDNLYKVSGDLRASSKTWLRVVGLDLVAVGEAESRSGGTSADPRL